MAAEHHAGKRLKCPKCGGAIKVPGAAESSGNENDWFDLDAPLPHELPPQPVVDPPELKIPGKRTATTIADPSERNASAASAPQIELGADDWLDGLPPPIEPASTAAGPLDQLDLPPLSESDLAALNSAGGLDDWSATGNASSPSRPQALDIPDDLPKGEYRAKCPVCESIHYVTMQQTGKQIHCSDCHSYFIVPPPPKQKPKPKMDIERAPTFAFTPTEAPRARSEAPGRLSAAEYLRAAEAEVEDEVDPAKEYESPDVKGWLVETFGIFKDPTLGAYWLGLSILASLPFIFIFGFNVPPAMFVGILIPSTTLALLFCALVLANAFAILEAVANGEERVSEWATFNPTEWIGDFFVAFAALFISSVPGLVLGLPLFGAGIISLGFVMLSIFGLFPFVLLSMLDNGTVTMPISADVSKSVKRCPDAWGTLYFSAMVLFVGQWFLYATIYLFMPPVIVAFTGAFLTVGFAFVYSAMVGRLAYRIGHSINNEPIAPQ